MEQIVKARLITPHVSNKIEGQNVAYENELILYDIDKTFTNKTSIKEIRLKLGNGTHQINSLSDLALNNLKYYNESEPYLYEVGDTWYNENKNELYIVESVDNTINLLIPEKQEEMSQVQILGYLKVAAQKKTSFAIKDSLGNRYENFGKIIELLEIGEDVQECLVKISYWSKKLSDLTLNENSYFELQVYDEEQEKEIAILFKIKNYQENAKIMTFHNITNLRNGIMEGSLEGIYSKAIGVKAVALGENTLAGAKAFKVKALVSGGYELDTENIGKIAVGDKFSIFLQQNYDFQGEIIRIEGNIVYVDNFINEEPGASSYLLLYEKPEEGDYIIGTGAFSAGYDSKALGVASHAEGYNTLAAGKYSHTEGRSTKAGYQGHAEGYNTYAGFGAHAENEQTRAEGKFSHAEGEWSTASGKVSHAEGYYTKAKGQGSHAEGSNTEAEGSNSHAEGIYTKATKDGAHSEGHYTTASGNGAHAEGTNTVGSGLYSHAEGSNTKAEGNNSHAEGTKTIARGKSQHVQGEYNKPEPESTNGASRGIYAHMVGNGKSEGERSNAYTLDWEGNGWYAGGIKAETIIESNEIKGAKIEGEQGLFGNEEGNVNITNGRITATNNIETETKVISNAVVTQGISSWAISNADTITTKDLKFTGTFSSDSTSPINLPNADLLVNSIQSFGLGGIGKAGNVYGSSLNVKDNNNKSVASIDNQGNGHFNSVTIGADKSFAIRYRGQVETTSDLKGENREGDFVSTTINPNLPETFLGFYVSGDEPFTGDIKLTKNGIEFYEVNNIFRKLLLYLTNTHLEYVNDIPEGTDVISNYSLNGPNFSRLVLTFSFDTGRVLQLDIATIRTQNKYKEEPYTWFAGEWLSPIDDIYANFKENALNVLMYAIPNEEDIDLTENPELEKYKKLSRSQENLYIYLNKKWVKLTNQTAFNGGSSIGKLPIIGYEDFCKYQINDENDILTCLNQAISENKTVYIMPGYYNYNGDRQYWSIPDIDDLHFIGIGEVTLDFKLAPKGTEFYNETISQSWIWENIIFNKEVTLSTLSLSGSTNYQRSAKVLNCQFNNKVDICDDHGTQNYFENCIFNDNINNSEYYGSNDSDLNIEYINCTFNINKWSTDINKILASKIEYCTFYFPIEQKNIVFGRAFTNNGGFNSSNLFTNNIYYLMGAETRFLTPNVWVENLSVKHSSFPWKPILEPINKNEEGLICKIDRDTCYINNNSSDNEVLIQNKNINLIQSHQVKEKNMLHNYDNDDMAPSFILLNGEEITPTGDYLEAYNEWKKDKSFSYLDGVNNSLILGHSIYANGSNFNITGTNHLVTGVSHTVEGQANVIGGMDVDELPDIQIIANHAEGVNNILPPHTRDTASPILRGRHIEGVSNIGNQLDGSHVQGKYNEEDTTDTLIHIVGNGTNNSNRSNAHTIDINGNGWFSGGLTLTNEHYPVIHYRDENNAFPQDNLALGQMFNLTNFSSDLTNEIELADEDKVINDTLQINNTIIKKYLLETFGYLLNADDFINYQITTIMPTLKFQTSSEILEFKNIYNINNNENFFNLTYEELIITNLNGDIIVSQNYTPNDNGEILLTNKKIKVLGVFNSLNEKYEAGLYLRTSDNTDWKKLSVFAKNANQDSPGSTPGGENPQNRLLIIKPTNGAYNFEIDLSTYGIKLGDIINFVCVGAGGAGGGVSSTKKGGNAGSYGYSSSSSNGGAPGTGFGAGGGGSCASSTSSSYHGGSGGGSGYVVMGGPHIVNDLTVNVTLGKAGIGGSGAGGDGGDTIFLGITAKGGEGGKKGGTSKPVGGQGGKQGEIGSSGNVLSSGGDGGNGWVPSNYNPESETISVYGAIANDNVPTYSGDGAIFIWY